MTTDKLNNPQISTSVPSNLPSSIAFIGGGNMASAMIGGLIKSGMPANAIQVVEPNADQAQKLTALYKVRTWPDAQTLGLQAKVQALVLAVKPQQMQSLCSQLLAHCKWINQSLLISVAAGITTGNLQQWLDHHPRVIRTMPNTPALIGKGIAGLASSAMIAPADRACAIAIMQSVGQAIWFEHESSLDAVTAVSGSGPAYVFYFLEALEKGALDLGLSAGDAKSLVLATFAGATELAQQSPDSFATLRERVTSKGGTTAAALEVFEQHSLNTHLRSALKAARDKSRALGEQINAAPQEQPQKTGNTP